MTELGHLNNRNRFVAILSISLTNEKMESGGRKIRQINEQRNRNTRPPNTKREDKKKNEKNTNLKNMQVGGFLRMGIVANDIAGIVQSGASTTVGFDA
jgi:hypothetical protein